MATGPSPALPTDVSGLVSAPRAELRRSAPRRTVRLRSGVVVGECGDGLVVVGADERHRVELPDTSAVARTLAQLRVGRPTSLLDASEDGLVAGVVSALGRAGLLVDVEDQVLLSQARASTRVRLVSAPAWREAAEAALTTGGLTITGEGSRAGDLTWVVSAGPPDWELHDTLLAGDEPVLFTTVHPSRVVVGPFVLPGSTACLRCMDAHAARRGPGPSGRRWGHPDDLPPLVLHRSLLVASAELCAWAEGRQPATWSATLSVDEHPVPQQRAWPQHPHCGCAWNGSSTG